MGFIFICVENDRSYSSFKMFKSDFLKCVLKASSMMKNKKKQKTQISSKLTWQI